MSGGEMETRVRPDNVTDLTAQNEATIRVVHRRWKQGRLTREAAAEVLEALGLIDYASGARVDTNGARRSLTAAQQRARDAM